MQAVHPQFDFQDLNELSQASKESMPLSRSKANLAVLEDYITSVIYGRPMSKRKTFAQINKTAEEVLASGSSSLLQDIVHKAFKSYIQNFFSEDSAQ